MTQTTKKQTQALIGYASMGCTSAMYYDANASYTSKRIVKT